MLELGSKGKTILITTHYIQEARQAHTVCIKYNKSYQILKSKNCPIYLRRPLFQRQKKIEFILIFNVF